MILGFDHDDASIFEAQRTFIREAGIAHAMVGMPHAIPKTPLHARLLAEGSLDPADESPFGTNVFPLRIGREELRDGYVGVLDDLYKPEAFFGRVEDLYLRRRITLGRAQTQYWRRHLWQRLKAQTADLLRAAVLQARLLWRVPESALRPEYLRRIGRLLKYAAIPQCSCITGLSAPCTITITRWPGRWLVRNARSSTHSGRGWPALAADSGWLGPVP